MKMMNSIIENKEIEFRDSKDRRDNSNKGKQRYGLKNQSKLSKNSPIKTLIPIQQIRIEVVLSAMMIRNQDSTQNLG